MLNLHSCEDLAFRSRTQRRLELWQGRLRSLTADGSRRKRLIPLLLGVCLHGMCGDNGVATGIHRPPDGDSLELPAACVATRDLEPGREGKIPETQRTGHAVGF